MLTLLALPEGARPRALADDAREAVIAAIALAEVPDPGADGLTPTLIAVRSHVKDLTQLSGAERALLEEWLSRILATS